MCFDFNIFKKRATKRYSKQYEDCFLSWFVGFSEGEASFIVNEKRNFFVINQKDPKVLFYLKDKLGFGRVKGPYTQKSSTTFSNYYKYIVSDKESSYFLSLLFKNNLILAKTNKRFILWEQFIDRSMDKNNANNESVLKINNSFQQNGWLSGFIDAEACFSATSVQSKDRKAEKRLRIKFSIRQSDEESTLIKIKEDLKVGYIESNKKKEKYFNHYIYVISSISSLPVLINYLKKYPLRSNKQISFVKWCKIINRLTDGESRQFGTRAYARIERLAKTINDFD